jgi:hypothetical protein
MTQTWRRKLTDDPFERGGRGCAGGGCDRTSRWWFRGCEGGGWSYQDGGPWCPYIVDLRRRKIEDIESTKLWKETHVD